MNPNQRLPVDDQSLDALIVLALTGRSVVPDEPVPDEDLSEFLSWEDRTALDAIDDDLVDQILAGEWQSPLEQPKPARRREHRELAGALNRDDEDGDLTDDVRAEIEKKIRELEKEQNEGKDQQP